MAITRCDPFAEMMNLSRNLDRMLDATFPRTYRPSGGWGLESFPVDVYERDDELVVKASLPGVHPEDLDINVTGDSLTIKAETRHEDEVKDEQFYRRERHAGHYQRVLQLPGHLATDKAEAEFDHGVLTLRIPKAEEARSKNIEVRNAKRIDAGSQAA